ncbi:MAG: Rossmann-like and DUF2520 domain-containing protein [Syntrophales bacterium]|jgi:predicted short-subunit dehydrogenase-like oxidoreductase (DUF2520 family)|nr:DUF2520 domain-containing protein [Syntrophales bacterium]
METFIIIGLGKVGTSIGYLLKKAGFTIVAAVDPSDEALARHISRTGGRTFRHPADLDVTADCYLITTGDDQIEPVCRILSDRIEPGAVVIHMSGAGSLALLDPARRAGAKTACIHPLQTFSDVESAIEALPGTVYGITCDPGLQSWAERLVAALGAIPFFIDDGDRPLYHAAACVVSNYLVTLIYMAERIYGRLGLDEEEARQAFWPLLRGTMQNIREKGSVPSLTGPIARGDAGTLQKHLLALGAAMPDMLPPYRELGKITADMALKKGGISSVESENIKTLLSKGA